MFPSDLAKYTRRQMLIRRNVFAALMVGCGLLSFGEFVARLPPPVRGVSPHFFQTYGPRFFPPSTSFLLRNDVAPGRPAPVAPRSFGSFLLIPVSTNENNTHSVLPSAHSCRKIDYQICMVWLRHFMSSDFVSFEKMFTHHRHATELMVYRYQGRRIFWSVSQNKKLKHFSWNNHRHLWGYLRAQTITTFCSPCQYVSSKNFKM